MTTLKFSELNEEQKQGAVLQMFRFNRNFNFPAASEMRGVSYENEEAVRKNAEMGFLDNSFAFEISDSDVKSYALINWDTVSPEDLKWTK